MRTTLDIDDDVLQAVKELAAQERTTAGKVLSNLARRALAPASGQGDVRNGVPLLPARPGESVVTVAEVERHLADDASSDDEPSSTAD